MMRFWFAEKEARDNKVFGILNTARCFLAHTLLVLV